MYGWDFLCSLACWGLLQAAVQPPSLRVCCSPGKVGSLGSPLLPLPCKPCREADCQVHTLQRRDSKCLCLVSSHLTSGDKSKYHLFTKLSTPEAFLEVCKARAVTPDGTNDSDVQRPTVKLVFFLQNCFLLHQDLDPKGNTWPEPTAAEVNQACAPHGQHLTGARRDGCSSGPELLCSSSSQDPSPRVPAMLPGCLGPPCTHCAASSRCGAPSGTPVPTGGCSLPRFVP